MTWDLTSYFSQFNAPEMRQFKERLLNDISCLKQEAAALPSLTGESAVSWEGILLRNEDIVRRMSHLGSYISCLVSADAHNEEYLKEEAELVRIRAELAKLRIEFLRAIKETDESFAVFVTRPALNSAHHYLDRMRQESRRAMTPDKEILATDLGIDGIQAWGRLYDTASAKLEFDMRFPDGTHRRLPMSHRRSLMEDPDRQIRKAAFDGGNAAWQSVEDTAAAALNAIAGTRLTLNRHRGVDHFLEIALFQSSISRRTLDAMFEALFSKLEVPRKILRLKAKFLGRPRLAWFDIGAPLDLPGSDKLSWDDAISIVGKSFKGAYPDLGNFFDQQIIAKNWVDWEPRTGKRPGGFCTTSMLNKESRIFMTYNQSLGDVLTLAHEAGHAYHGAMMREVRPYGRGYPMTLAETASTFAEQVLINGILDDPAISAAQKTRILDVEIGHGVIYLLDIPVRYEFERAFYEERASGPLTVSRLKELMVQTERNIFGDVLAVGAEDAYFWASKLHFYIAGITFYNFPYIFGYLLSRALYEMFKKDSMGFLPNYEKLLRQAGSDTVENVIQQTVGRKIDNPQFWAEAIDSLKEPAARLEILLRDSKPLTVEEADIFPKDE
jgi:oligoendopeptidase F